MFHVDDIFGGFSFIFPADPVIDKVLREFDCPEDVMIKCTVGNRQMYVELLMKGEGTGSDQLLYQMSKNVCTP